MVQDHWSVGEPISSLTWSASYDKLAFCTPQVNTVCYIDKISCCDMHLLMYICLLCVLSKYMYNIRHGQCLSTVLSV